MATSVAEAAVMARGQLKSYREGQGQRWCRAEVVETKDSENVKIGYEEL
jgi:hypothetical protein